MPRTAFARALNLFAVSEVGVLCALVLVDRALLRARAGVRLRAQRPRHPHRRLLRRHHRDRPDDPPGLRRVRSLGRLGRGPCGRRRREADDGARAPGSAGDPRRRARRRVGRPRQRPCGRAASHPRLHPDTRDALHRPGPDPGRHQRLPRSTRCRPSVGDIGSAQVALRPRLELRLLHSRSPWPRTSCCGGPCSGATCTRPAATRRWRASSASTPTRYKIGAFVLRRHARPRSPACS